MVNKRAKARRNVPRDARRDFPFKDQLQMYAKVTAMLGNGRVRATCDDGAERLCTIRGSMRRREWVHVGDTILVSLRTFDNSTDDDDETPNPKPQTKTDKADVIFRYQESEVQQLRRFGEIDFENDTEDSDVVFEVDVENI